ncbi:MAG: hypothetical protein IPJ90_23010 [Anaerolineaceae bacterium]|nr:hypothetical protein [Anaerolineaceae bacterium]
MNLNLITTVKICAIVAVPIMVAIIWLLPKFLNSRRSIKMLIGAIIVSIYSVLIVSIVDGSSLQIQNMKFVATFTALVWGGAGFLVGAYFDVRSRVELGTKYYQEFPRLRMHGAEYGVIGATISLPLGIVTGWIVMVYGASLIGLILSITVGIVLGGLLGNVLARYSPAVARSS